VSAHVAGLKPRSKAAIVQLLVPEFKAFKAKSGSGILCPLLDGSNPIEKNLLRTTPAKGEYQKSNWFAASKAHFPCLMSMSYWPKLSGSPKSPGSLLESCKMFSDNGKQSGTQEQNRPQSTKPTPT